MKHIRYTTQVNVAMTENEKTKLEDVANAAQMSMSEVARIGIAKEVARRARSAVRSLCEGRAKK